jgi:hypothetical protein
MEKIVLEYLDTSISNDVSDFIENNKSVVYGDNSDNRELKIKSDTKTLASRNFNDSQDFNNSHRGLQPYKILKTMLNEERNILHQYINIINKLKNE